MVDFNPDFSEDDFELTENAELDLNTKTDTDVESKDFMSIKVAAPNKDVMSMNNLLLITQSHMEDDLQCRQEIADVTNALRKNSYLMGIKDLLEYMKIKIREREFHVDCILKVVQIVQKTELAREMLIGSDRKERIIEATDRTKINKLLGMFNENAIDEAKYE